MEKERYYAVAIDNYWDAKMTLRDRQNYNSVVKDCAQSLVYLTKYVVGDITDAAQCYTALQIRLDFNCDEDSYKKLWDAYGCQVENSTEEEAIESIELISGLIYKVQQCRDSKQKLAVQERREQ